MMEGRIVESAEAITAPHLCPGLPGCGEDLWHAWHTLGSLHVASRFWHSLACTSGVDMGGLVLCLQSYDDLKCHSMLSCTCNRVSYTKVRFCREDHVLPRDIHHL